MDDVNVGVGLFVFAAFLGGLVNGLSGFAMSLAVSGIWLHILSPIETVTLLAGYGLIVQGYGMIKLRRALDWRRLAPFLAGGVVGVPAGVILLAYIEPARVRMVVGVLLVAYAGWGLARPNFTPIKADVRADLGIGVVNGVLGGLTGFAGIVVVVWCQLRGFSKDIQRAVSQPVTFVAFALSALALALKGTVTADTLRLYLYGLPAVAAGMWSGFRLYGKLDDAAFRKLVLVLLLAAGIGLLVR